MGSIANIKPLVSEEEGEGVIDFAPHVPPGEYIVKFVWSETRLFNGKGPKVYLYFGIVKGDYIGLEIPSYYNVTELIGSARKSGGFRVGGRSKYARHYLGVLGDPPNSKKMLPSHFTGRSIRCVIRDTKNDSEGRSLPGPCCYSVIDDLIEIVDD